ncbi:MAG: aminodeoxychorismate synthase component I [Gammaproteobacteria bacterium]
MEKQSSAVEIAYGDPASIFKSFSQEKWAIFLDSADAARQLDDTNRFSYIAIDPFETIFIKNSQCFISGTEVSNPFKYLKNILDKFKVEHRDDLPPFQGGALGYFSYDLCHYLEVINKPHKIEESVYADMAIGLYDVIISFDHVLQKAWIVSAGISLDNEKSKISKYIEILKKTNQSISAPMTAEVELVSSFNKKTYADLVASAQKYILEGDIFEVNLSHRFKATLDSRLENKYDLYLKMRSHNPSPFSAFLNFVDHQILSTSPERFLLLKHNGEVSTRPIKGTAPRGKTSEEDKIISDQLLMSEKDRSENIIITDLLRNDLSKVCDPNSVKVKKLCGIETYPTVHHLVTVVEGQIKSDYTALDLLEACFPGGSITGAPKVRAMQIIYKLEPTQRGPYCGSIGYIGFSGTMDTSIVIRTLLFHGHTITYQVGGAVILDSSPEEEYEETITKSVSIRNVLST